MKLSVLFFFLSIINATASLYSQSTKFSMSLEQVSVEEVIKEIKRNSDFNFIFNYDLVKNLELVNINIKNATVEQLLDQALSGSNLTYRIEDKVIILSPAKPQAVSSPVKQHQARQKVISGIVRDENGDILPFATIIVKGTTKGTASGLDGKFSILLDQVEGTILQISSIGYVTQEMALQDQGELTIVLQKDNTSIDEVVVTGYQHIEKRKLSSAIVTVKMEDINKAASLSVDQMLQGEVAGLTVINNTGTPGATPKIRIRGTSSITGNREPVWVVDGVILDDPVPVSAVEINSFDNINLIGNAISSINPEDIARIDVLKDASATAIYGSKAANGVIVITTKRGQKGKPRIHFSNTTAITERPSYNRLNLMNSKERVDVSREIYERGLTYEYSPASVGYEGALYDLFSKQITQEEFSQRIKLMEETNTDWFDHLYRNALTQKNTLSISGADDVTNYYFSVGYSNQQSTAIQSGVKNLSSIMKLDFKLRKNLNIGFQLRGALNNREYHHPSISSYGYAHNTSRVIPITDTNGNRVFYNKDASNGYIFKYNILNELDNSGNTSETEYVNFNTNINWDIKPWLSYIGLFGLNTSKATEETWFNDRTYLAARLRGTELDQWDFMNEDLRELSELPFGGEYNANNTKLLAYTIRNMVNIYETFGKKHEVNATLGTEVRSSNYSGLSSVQRGYMPERGKTFAMINPVDYPEYANWQLNHPNVITDKLTRYVSLFSTFTYAYDNRYSFNLNYRTDGSNKFGQDDANKFLPVWSSSARWNIHNEKMLIGTNAINNLALRFSYGIQGNVAEEDTPKLIIRQEAFNAISGEYGASLVRLPNPELRWEKTKSYNLGIDYAFFKSRFKGSIELYKKLGSDMLVMRDVSPTSGVNSVKINGGSLENKGWEFFFSADLIRTKNVTWDIFGVASKNYNKVTDAGENKVYSYHDYINGNIVVKGEPIDGFYSYRYSGLDPETGHPTFDGLEEEEGMTEEDVFASVFEYSGQRDPDLDGSFGSSVRYKDFSLNLNFNYSFGRNIRLNNLFSSSQRLPQPQQNMSGEFVDRWRQPGDENRTNIPALSSDPLRLSGREYTVGSNLWEMYNKSNLRVVSGDYIRLRNVTFRYNVSSKFCESIKLASATISLEASNLFVIASKELNGQDPELSSGIGYGSMPLTSTYALSLSVNF
jgi:TonB-linked SusC/RagA family outer membrane protein